MLIAELLTAELLTANFMTVSSLGHTVRSDRHLPVNRSNPGEIS